MTVTAVPAQPVREAPVSYRKNVDRLRGPQLSALRRAYAEVMALPDERGFQYWAGVHGLPLPIWCEHHTDLFLPWHRAYLYFFELALKDRDPVVTLPWWDWSSAISHARGLPEAYTAETVADQPNPLSGGVISALAREQGADQGIEAPERSFRDPADPARLPSRQDVLDMLELNDFQDFQQQLEQVHDFVHVWVGGTVGEVPYAAYDPIFWAHHAMIDRVWRLWQLRHPTAGLPADILDEALPPFRMTVRQTLRVTDLGYDYAVFSSRVRMGG